MFKIANSTHASPFDYEQLADDDKELWLIRVPHNVSFSASTYYAVAISFSIPSMGMFICAFGFWEGLLTTSNIYFFSLGKNYTSCIFFKLCRWFFSGMRQAWSWTIKIKRVAQLIGNTNSNLLLRIHINADYFIRPCRNEIQASGRSLSWKESRKTFQTFVVVLHVSRTRSIGGIWREPLVRWPGDVWIQMLGSLHEEKRQTGIW